MTVHAPEGKFETQRLVAVLGASSYTYVEASRGQDLRSWLASHVRALHFCSMCSGPASSRQAEVGGDVALPLRAGAEPQLPLNLPSALYRGSGSDQLPTQPSRALANRHP